MEPVVTAAIVSGIFAATSSLLTLFVKNKLDNRPLQPISKNRRNALTGQWNGTVYQDEGPKSFSEKESKSIKFTTNAKLTATRKVVQGEITIHWIEKDTHVTFDLARRFP